MPKSAYDINDLQVVELDDWTTFIRVKRAGVKNLVGTIESSYVKKPTGIDENPPDVESVPPMFVGGQVDIGTFIIYDHAVTNNIVGAAWISLSGSTYVERFLKVQGASFPFKAQATGGTVRWKHIDQTHADSDAFVTWLNSNYSSITWANATKYRLDYQPVANPTPW
jgi:hypothetical protein